MNTILNQFFNTFANNSTTSHDVKKNQFIECVNDRANHPKDCYEYKIGNVEYMIKCVYDFNWNGYIKLPNGLADAKMTLSEIAKIYNVYNDISYFDPANNVIGFTTVSVTDYCYLRDKSTNDKKHSYKPFDFVKHQTEKLAQQVHNRFLMQQRSLSSKFVQKTAKSVLNFDDRKIIFDGCGNFIIIHKNDTNASQNSVPKHNVKSNSSRKNDSFFANLGKLTPIVENVIKDKERRSNKSIKSKISDLLSSHFKECLNVSNTKTQPIEDSSKDEESESLKDLPPLVEDSSSFEELPPPLVDASYFNSSDTSESSDSTDSESSSSHEFASISSTNNVDSIPSTSHNFASFSSTSHNSSSSDDDSSSSSSDESSSSDDSNYEELKIDQLAEIHRRMLYQKYIDRVNQEENNISHEVNNSNQDDNSINQDDTSINQDDNNINQDDNTPSQSDNCTSYDTIYKMYLSGLNTPQDNENIHQNDDNNEIVHEDNNNNDEIVHQDNNDEIINQDDQDNNDEIVNQDDQDNNEKPSVNISNIDYDTILAIETLIPGAFEKFTENKENKDNKTTCICDNCEEL